MNLLENLELFSSRAALIAWNFADLQWYISAATKSQAIELVGVDIIG